MAQYYDFSDDEIKEILGKYQLEHVEYESIEEGSGNTNYIVRTVQDQYILTIFEIEKVRVQNLCKLLRTLEYYNFPSPRIQETMNGSSITSYLGKPVLLKPYVSGQIAEILDEMMIDQVGGEIARLHEIPSPEFMPDTHAYGLETFSRALDQNIDSVYEHWLAQKYDYLTEIIPPELPRGLIHGDLFVDNVLFDGQVLKAVLDFEEACEYYKVFDLGMAVVGTCVEETDLVIPKVRSLVSGYQKVRELEDEEKQLLQLFVEYAAIATSSWRFWKFNIDTPMDDMADRYWEMVNIAEMVGAISGEEFIAAVF